MNQLYFIQCEVLGRHVLDSVEEVELLISFQKHTHFIKQFEDSMFEFSWTLLGAVPYFVKMCFCENGFLDHELNELSTLFDQQVMLVDTEQNVKYVVIS